MLVRRIASWRRTISASPSLQLWPVLVPEHVSLLAVFVSLLSVLGGYGSRQQLRQEEVSALIHSDWLDEVHVSSDPSLEKDALLVIVVVVAPAVAAADAADADVPNYHRSCSFRLLLSWHLVQTWMTTRDLVLLLRDHC